MPATLKPGPVPPAAPAAARKHRLPLPLPGGAGAAALLWKGAAFLAGLFAAGGSVCGAAPFGLALVLGCAPGYAPAAAAGAAAGSLLLLPPAAALPLAAGLLAALAARLLWRERFAPAAAAACALLLAGHGLVALRAGLLPGQVLTALLTAGLGVGLGRAVRALPAQTPRGACLWLAMAVACAQRFSPFGLAPGLALLSAAGLAAAAAGPAGAGACLLWAAALAAAQPSLCGAALAAALASPAANALAGGERRRAAGLFAAGFTAAALALPRPDPLLPALLSAWAGAALFAFVPAALLPPRAAPAPVPEAAAPDGEAARRLNDVAAALADVADTVNAVCERRLPPRGETFDFVVDYVARRLCQGCRQRERCWLHSYSGMVDGLYHLKAPLEARGRVELEELPGMLTACVRPSDLCSAAAHGYRLWRSRRQSRAQAAVLRTALTDQYATVARALAQLAGQLGQAGLPDPQRAAKAAQLFADLGLETLDCRVTSDLYGRLHVCVTVARAAFAPDELAALAADLGRGCRRDLTLPQVSSRGAVTTLTFAERPLYRAVFGAASRPADGQTVCGDAFEQFCDPAGRAQLLLCDGMGTGPAAAVDGRLAARLTARLLQAGLAAEAAARLVNTALGLQSGDRESCTTLDLWTVDLYTGRAAGCKAGAAPSFLVRDGVPRALEEGGGLPIGVLDTVTARTAALTLAEGDVLVLVSDGILADGPGWLLPQLAQCARLGHTPAQLAQAVLETAARRPGGMRDDCTVLAVQLLRA